MYTTMMWNSKFHYYVVFIEQCHALPATVYKNKKLRIIASPSGVMTDSGWNWTPYT
jgi:hypothetical protein